MIRPLLHRSLERRAEQILYRLAPHLPSAGDVLDIGCGTGHNAETGRRRMPGLIFHEADVVDMKVVGNTPAMIVGDRLPFADGQFCCGLALFILHYPRDPVALLRDARRVIDGPLLVLQSTYQGAWSRIILRAREFVQGRGAFLFARGIGYLRPVECPLTPSRLMDRSYLEEVFRNSGWSVRACVPERWPLTHVSRDLFILEKA